MKNPHEWEYVAWHTFMCKNCRCRYSASWHPPKERCPALKIRKIYERSYAKEEENKQED